MIGRTISHYKILEKLGGGGMGIVYTAEDLKLGRHVALKFLPLELSQEDKRRRRFVQEAKAASFLDHPNLCTIYEIDQTPDGQMFIAMALYEGDTLKTKIASGLISPQNTIDIAVQIASGLAVAHENGIIHRDIKPANIIVTRSGLVKILDFGLAKLAGASQITEAETAVGTISYMSPEQALGKPVDQRTDIWSWGIVLHEMLTGQVPHRAQTPVQILHALFSPDPLNISHPMISSEVLPVLEKALKKDPEARYSSILQAKQDLQNVKLSSHSYSVTVATYKPAEPTIAELGLTVSPQKAEKKPLTFVVCAVAGYSEMLEQLPFDDVNLFLNRVQADADALAGNCSGVLNEFEPDRIVVLFGIPAAQENDFLTAVQYAFDLQSAVAAIAKDFGFPPHDSGSLRCGIHSGLVLMQPSVREKRKYEITGQPFQIALTLAANAKPFEILITQESRRLTRNSFLTEPRDAILFPGLSTSSNAYCLRHEADSSSGTFLSPFTGRGKELETLKNCWHKALEGEGQFLTVIGESGAGKTRLFTEFRARAQEETRYLHGYCEPASASIPYAPFRALLLHGLDLFKNGTAEEAIHKIQSLDPILREYTPLYLHLLSLQSDRFPFPKHLEGENLRFAILDALTAFVMVDKRPLLLFLEDWHWADEASQNALRQILEMLPERRALVVVTCRPESSLDWAGVRNHQQIYLDPLESAYSKALASFLLGAESISEPLMQLIQDRTGGNPFFIEEICFSLKEEGKIKIENSTAILKDSEKQLRLPETIQAVLLSRLDRLDRRTRELLQAAAVIGREFNRTILQHISKNESNLGGCLATLKKLGLIQQLHVLPEAIYKFRHALTQEVAYESLIAQEKKQLHQSVAEAMEELYRDRLEEHLDALADHFSKAGVWHKAVDYGMKASKRAVSLGQFSEALQTLKRAEQWLSGIPPQEESRRRLEIEMMLDEERLCETLGIRDRQEQILRELLVALKSEENDSLRMEVYRRQGELFTLLGRFDAAEGALQQSLKLSRLLQDRSGERNVLRSIGFMQWHHGQNQEAIASNQQALDIDRERGDIEAEATDLTNLGSLYRSQKDHAAAIECLQEALKLYERMEDPVKHAAALHLFGNVHRDLGNNEEAMHYMQAAMAVSTRHRLVIMQGFHLTSLANMCWQQGKVEECLELQKQAVEITRKSRYAEGLTNSLRMVGETLQSMGRSSEALPYYQEAATLFSRLKDYRNEAAMWNKIAAIYEEQKLWNEALGALDKLRILDEASQMWKDAANVTERMAVLCRKQESFDQAIRHYRTALSHLERIAEYPAIAGILNSIAILEWNEGSYIAALEDYRKALSIFEDHDDQVHRGLILNSIGLTLKSMGKHQEALETLQQALEINRETGQRKLEGHSLSTIADVYSDLGNFSLAMKYYEEALRVKRESGDARGEAWMLYHLARVQSHLSPTPGLKNYMIEAEKMVANAGDSKLTEAWTKFQRMQKNSGGNHA